MITLSHIVQFLGAVTVVSLGSMVIAYEGGRAIESRRGTRDCRFCKGIGCEHCAGSGWVDDREMRAGVGR